MAGKIKEVSERRGSPIYTLLSFAEVAQVDQLRAHFGEGTSRSEAIRRAIALATATIGGGK